MDKKPCYGFFDLDSAAYDGASAAQKDRYKWVHPTLGETETFKKAVEAKEWLDERSMFEGDTEEWTREKFQEIGTLEEALKATEDSVKSFVSTFEKLGCETRPLIKRGFLTRSGVTKLKDMKGLQDQYQFNRIGKPKPIYLEQCKNHILKVFDWVELAPSGYEADAPVIGFAERKGTDAVVLSIDKDLKQAHHVYFIDMNDFYHERKLMLCGDLGEIWEEKTYKGAAKFNGHGFKLLCYQAIVGDSSDGYKGLRGIGHKAGMALISPCNSKEECVKALYDTYKKKIGESITYTSWDGEEQTRTPVELLQQHFTLAYQERSSKDKFEVMDYLTEEDL